MATSRPTRARPSDLIRDLARAGSASTAPDPAPRPALAHPDPLVRRRALGAVHRTGGLTRAELTAALDDPDARVRTRALGLVALLDPDPALAAAARSALADPASLVAEAAAFALGERGDPEDADLVDALADLARTHPDPLCREAAVAALGSLGHPRGLTAVLIALEDKPAVRRRAVCALAAFDGPEVDEALRRSTGDRDWQTRTIAEELLGIGGPSPDGPEGSQPARDEERPE